MDSPVYDERSYFKRFFEKEKLSEKKSISLIFFSNFKSIPNQPKKAVLYITDRESELNIRKHIENLKINSPRLLFYYEKNSRFYIFTEYCEKRSLREYLETRDKIHKKTLFKHFLIISSNLKSLHEQGVFNVDISPENIYLTISDNPKIGKFNTCIIRDYITPSNLKGSLSYISPYCQDLFSRPDDKGVYIEDFVHEDRYKLGKTIFECLIRRFNINFQDFTYEDIANFISINLEKKNFNNQLTRLLIEFIKFKDDSYYSLKELNDLFLQIINKRPTLFKDDVKLDESMKSYETKFSCKAVPVNPGIQIIMNNSLYSKLEQSKKILPTMSINFNPEKKSLFFGPTISLPAAEEACKQPLLYWSKNSSALENIIKEEIKYEHKNESVTCEQVNIRPKKSDDSLKGNMNGTVSSKQIILRPQKSDDMPKAKNEKIDNYKTIPQKIHTSRNSAGFCRKCKKSDIEIKLSCGHQYHLSCLKSELTLQNSNGNSQESSYHCSICFKPIILTEHPDLENFKRNSLSNLE